MFWKSAQCLAFALLAARSAHARLVVGPQVPVGDNRRVHAAYDQFAPLVASNGREFLTMWRDSRTAMPGYQSGDVYVARIDTLGRIIQASAHQFSSSIDALALASNGNGYVLAFRTVDGLFTVHLNGEGERVAEPTLITRSDGIASLASNGDGYLLVLGLRSSQYGTLAFMLDTDGAVTRNLILDGSDAPIAIALLGFDYHVFTTAMSCDTRGNCASSVRHELVSGRGEVRKLPSVAPGVPAYVEVAATGGRGRLAVVLFIPAPTHRTISYELLDENGSVIAGLQNAAITGIQAYETNSFAAFDGDEFLFGWSDATGIRYFRISTDGSLLDPIPVTLSAEGGPPVGFASTHSSQILVRADLNGGTYTDLLSRTVSNFGELAAAPDEIVAFSGAVQTQPAVADLGSRTFAVWSELDAHQEIRGAFLNKGSATAGPPLLISAATNRDQTSPSVVIGSSSMLVVWSELNSEEPLKSRILAKRISFDGQLLDFEPIVVATTELPRLTSVAFDGSQFLAVWSRIDVNAARITASGEVLDRTPIVVSRRKDFYGNPLSLKVVWTGEIFLTVWLDVASNIIPEDRPYVTGRYARVTTAGDVIDPVESPILWVKYGGVASRLDVGFGNGRAVIAWAQDYVFPESDLGGGCVYALSLNANGERIADQGQVACADHLLLDSVAVAFGGSRPIVVWGQRDDDGLATLRAAPLDANGNAAEQPTVIASHIQLFATAISSGQSATLAYSRVTADQDDVARIFLTTIGVEGQTRRRAVR